MVWRTYVLLGSLVLLPILGGCSYNRLTDPAVKAYRAGDYAKAETEATKILQKAKPHDRLLICLEHGNIARMNSTIAPDNTTFDEAEQLFAKYDNESKLQLDQELGAMLVNQTLMDYRGYGYDRIMVNAYKALNHLAAGQADDARVEIARVAEAQKACLERYHNQIEKARKDRAQLAEKNEVDVETDKTLASDEYNSALADALSEFEEVKAEDPIPDQQHITLYYNPFAEYLQGIFFLHSTDPGDSEIGRVALRNTAGMVTNAHLERDVVNAEMIANGQRLDRTYIIFETGIAPRREQFKIRLPIFVFNVAVKDTKVDYIAMAFPKLVKENDYHEYLTVTTNDGTWETQMLADMDRIVAREFKNDLPGIITRTIISTVFKTAASYAAAEAVKDQNIWTKIAVRGGAMIYNELTTQADLRTWRTLPKQIQIASVPTPADGQLNLIAPTGATVSTVAVEAGKSHVIWVRVPSTTAPGIVRQAGLN